MTDTPRTDAEWYKAAPAYGSPEVVTAEFARSLERELAQAIVALESGFMPGTYARLKSLQDKERELANAHGIAQACEMRAEKAERELARVTAERNALDCSAREANGTYHCRLESPCVSCRLRLVTAERDAALADARRYRWLRTDKNQHIEFGGRLYVFLQPEALDKAIDARMQEDSDG